MDEHLQTTGKAVPGYDGKKMTNLAELSLVSGTWFVVEPVIKIIDQECITLECFFCQSVTC